MITKLWTPPLSTSYTLGTATIENRAGLTRRVMQRVTLPFNEADDFRIGDQITVADSGTGRSEVCQVESWAMPYPSGSERIVRVHYPAILPASNLRIAHTFEVGGTGSLPPFTQHPAVTAALANMRVVFFCGPKQWAFVELFRPDMVPEVLLDGPRVRRLRYFARVYEPSHAPTFRTQFWCEMVLHVYADENYMLAQFAFGVDDPRIDSYYEERAGLTDEESEVGFDIYGINDYRDARVQPLNTQSTVRSLTWDQGTARWRWVWDRRTLNTAGGIWLNQRYPWGFGGQAKAVITCTTGETDQLRLDSAEAWHSQPVFNPGIADFWSRKSEAHGPWGTMPRRPKIHEHSANLNNETIRTRLEQEAWAEANVSADRYCASPYAWNHRASDALARVWHQNDGQTGGLHEWWHKNPNIAAQLYSVPGLSHYAERALYLCPWTYAGFREVDGRLLNLIDHPGMGNDRGRPGWPGDTHGKLTPPPLNVPMMLDPIGGGRLIGADTAHMEGPWAHAHAMLFGDDGARLLAEQITYGPLHMGSWHSALGSRAEVGEQRAWARGTTMWAWSLWVFGADRRLVDRCADSYLLWRVLPQMQATDLQFPGRVVQSVYFIHPGSEGQSRVTLANYWYLRPWEYGHAVGEFAIARLASHVRSELAFCADHARANARDIFRYGSPRKVDESTGEILFTFLRQGRYEPAQAAGIVDGGTRQLTSAEMNDNNWTLCAPINGGGECGDPPTNDGHMRLGTPGGGGTISFTEGMAWMVLDGPLALGDIVLQRYVQDMVRFRADPSPSPTGSYLYWIDKDLFKWSSGRMDDIVEGPATALGNHGLAQLASIAASRLFASSVWVTRTDSAVIARHNRATGAQESSGSVTSPPATPWTGACVHLDGAVEVLALLDGLDPGLNRATYRVLVVQEAAIGTTVRDWTFTFADAVKREVRGIAWMPQLGRYLIGAGRTGEVASAWLLTPGAATAEKCSLPMSPTSAARIILDVPDVHSLAITGDGVLLTVTSAGGDRHHYAWNPHSSMWGIARETKTGDAAVSYLPLIGRDDDALRLVTATPGGTFWSHPI